jgi:hypothetical protein
MPSSFSKILTQEEGAFNKLQALSCIGVSRVQTELV